MQRDELVKIIKGFKGVCPFGAPDLSESAAAALYFEHFKEWPTERLISILSRLTTSGRFPSIDEIKRAGGDASMLEPSLKVQATEIANRIVSSIRLDGSYNHDRAMKRIGPVGWEAIHRKGGWYLLCETLQDEDHGTFIAQMRDLIEGMLQSGGKKFGMEALPSNDNPSALSAALRIAEKGGQ